MEQPTELQVSRWIELLRRRWRLVAALVAGAATLGLVGALAQGPTYTARTTVLLQAPLDEQGADGGVGGSVQALSQLAGSDIVRAEARKAVGGGPRLDVKVGQDGQVLEFLASTSSSTRAARAADHFAGAFVSLSEAATARQSALAERALQLKVRQLDAQLEAGDLSEAEKLALAARRGSYATALNRLLVRRELAAGGQAFVVSAAAIPAAPSSRSPLLFVLLLGSAGFVVAMVVAGGLETRHEVVRPPAELLAARVAEVSSQAHRVVDLVPAHRASEGRRQRRGVGGVVAPSRSADADAFTTLRASLDHGAPPGGRVIAVAEVVEHGGAGAAAANLAFAFARAGRSTALASLDLRGGTPQVPFALLGTTEGARTSRRRAKTLGGEEGLGASRVVPADTVLASLQPLTSRAVSGVGNLVVVAHGSGAQPEDLLSAAALGAYSRALAGIAGIVVVGVPAATTFPDLMLLSPYVDEVLLVARDGRTATLEVQTAVRRIERAGGPAPSILVMSPRRRAVRDTALRCLLQVDVTARREAEVSRAEGEQNAQTPVAQAALSRTPQGAVGEAPPEPESGTPEPPAPGERLRAVRAGVEDSGPESSRLVEELGGADDVDARLEGLRDALHVNGPQRGSAR